MMNEIDFRCFIEAIPGLCLPEDCFLLYSLTCNLDLKGDILEIGAFKGRTTVTLAKGLIDAGKTGRVYSIEANLFNTRPELLRSLEESGTKEKVQVIFKDSAAASKGWQSPLKFIWIDTDGNYLSARSDFMLWERHLVKGGIIALSCISDPGIQRMIKGCLIESGRFSSVIFSKSICFAYKEKDTEENLFFQIAYIRFIYTLYLLSKNLLYRLYALMPFIPRRDFILKRLIKKIFEGLFML